MKNEKSGDGEWRKPLMDTDGECRTRGGKKPLIFTNPTLMGIRERTGSCSHKGTENTKGKGRIVHLSAVFAQAGEFHELTRKRKILKDGIVNFILRVAK